MMHKGQDGPHDYRNSITMHTPDMPKSSSDGPMPAGSVHDEMTESPVPSASSFSDAHSASRGASFDAWGMYTSPTTPGHYGSSPMFPSAEPHFSMTMEATNVTHVGGEPGPAAYSWPDATGGGLGSSKE